MSDNARETAMIELKALMKREENVEYGTMKTHFNTGEICSPYYDVVDHFGYDREVVAVALGYFDRYIQSQSGNGPLDRNKLHFVFITCIFLATKAKHSLSESEAERLVRALGTLSPINIDTRTVLDMEEELLKTLDWRLNPPTMHQFAASYSELHPLRGGDIEMFDYLRNVTFLQVEMALFDKTLMINYKPSVIAFAAMLRTEEQIDDAVLDFEMRDQFLSLQPILNLDPSLVLEAMFALENEIPRIPTVEEMKRRGDPPSTPTVPQEESVGYAPESPTGVGGVGVI